MTVCHYYLDAKDMPTHVPAEELHVLLYGGNFPKAGAAAIGNQVKDLYLRFGVQPSARAVDLVSIALAVTAADTFVVREDSDSGWGRELHLRVPLRSPDHWRKVSTSLARTLGFLSGDSWSFEFLPDGEEPPARAAILVHQRRIDLAAGDSVSLFSGGLDSTIATLSAIARGERPILVSHAYAGDQGVQDGIVERLPEKLQHVSVNAWPNSDRTSEISMRTRSFLFITIAALVADLKSKLGGGGVVELRVPENGLIALNAPLTPRRIGTHSTRTTHPHYLARLQAVFDAVGIAAKIVNPFEVQTKGEMVASLKDDALFGALASETISCGKWKRDGKQCGRCVPCLIRRASLYAGEIDDLTDYQSPKLVDVLKDEDIRDDLVAMMTAVARLKTNDLGRWVSRSGPLPADRSRRLALVDVHRRGLLEVGRYLSDSGLRI